MGLKIGELAERAEVNLQTLRYYEREKLLPEPPRLSSGYRAYPDSAVRRVRFIKRAGDRVYLGGGPGTALAAHRPNEREIGSARARAGENRRHRKQDTHAEGYENGTSASHRALFRMRSREQVSYSGEGFIAKIRTESAEARR